MHHGFLELFGLKRQTVGDSVGTVFGGCHDPFHRVNQVSLPPAKKREIIDRKGWRGQAELPARRVLLEIGRRGESTCERVCHCLAALSGLHAGARGSKGRPSSASASHPRVALL